MPQILTADGRYLLVEQESDGNAVVYDHGRAVWDRRSYEARLGESAPPRSPTAPSPQLPTPNPQPSAGGGRIIRVTDERDGPIRRRMYSDLANAYVNTALNAAFVFCGTDDGPRFFQVDLWGERVDRLDIRLPYGGETEGWSWDKAGRVVLCDGPRLRRVNPLNSDDDQVLFDLSDDPRFANCDIFQPHSSDDGQTHSATVRRIVREGTYPNIGTVVFFNGRQEYFPTQGEFDLDESQVSRCGRWIVIKEKDRATKLLRNRIIELATRVTRTLTNADGAVGHSDCGPGILIGEWSPQRGEADGQCVLWDLRTWKRRTVFPTWNMGYVSYRAGVCLGSNDTHLSLVALDGSGLTSLVTLDHPANPLDDDYYDQRAKANLDDSGRVACYMDGGVVKLLVL